MATRLLKSKNGKFATVLVRDISMSEPTFLPLQEALEKAVRSADVIVTATNSSTPLFPGEWLRDGTHINAVGAYQPTTCEVDEACAKRCRSE